eukprot:3149428-Prymnesium_polylepis.1
MRRTAEFRSRGARAVRRLGVLSSAAGVGTTHAAAAASRMPWFLPSSSHVWHHQAAVIHRFGTMRTSAAPQRPR